MAKYRTADEVFEEYIRDPRNAKRFAEHEIGLAVTRLFTRLRKDAGLRQEDLAQRVGGSQAYVAKLEGGAYDRCALPTLRTFARALGYDLNVESMVHPLGTAPQFDPTDRPARLADEPRADESDAALRAALAESLMSIDAHAALVECLTSGDAVTVVAELSESQTAAA